MSEGKIILLNGEDFSIRSKMKKLEKSCDENQGKKRRHLCRLFSNRLNTMFMELRDARGEDGSCSTGYSLLKPPALVISLVISTALAGVRYAHRAPALSFFIFIVMPAAVFVSSFSIIGPAFAGGVLS